MEKERMTKQELLEAIQDEWQNLLSTLDLLSETQMLQTGDEDGWNVKDILAHITAWELLMVDWIEASLRGETPDRPVPGEPWDDLDLINQQFYDLHKGSPLSEVFAQFHNVHHVAYSKVASLTERDLMDPERFVWRAGHPLWHMVADNTWRHYDEHREVIEDWLKD